MMREVADGRLEVTPTFAEEMSYCLGCLACQTACPAGVDYATLLENARGEVERRHVGGGPWRPPPGNSRSVRSMIERGNMW